MSIIILLKIIILYVKSKVKKFNKEPKSIDFLVEWYSIKEIV